MLSKRQEVKIEVQPDGTLLTRTAIIVEEDGREIARNYVREVLPPGSSLDGKDARLATVAGAVWTDDVVAAHRARAAAAAAARPGKLTAGGGGATG